MFYITTDFFVVLVFSVLAVWIAIGVFSSRLESEVVCPNCDTQGLPEMTRRGLKDVAVCQNCGFALGGVPVALKGSYGEQADDASPDA